jgi:feruloyl esterase
MHRYSKPSRICTALVFAATAASAATCESLAALSLPQTQITAAQSVSVSDYTPPGASQPLHNLPAFCRVAATLTPSKDSDVKIEVWLPASGWNGKLQSVGNGGWSGAINYTGSPSGLTTMSCFVLIVRVSPVHRCLSKHVS